MDPINVRYQAHSTLSKLHNDDSFVRFVLGPFGSGKSVGCAMEVFRRACLQPPGPDGIRRSRWAIVRTSYRELQDTTLRTWRDWIPPQLGTWKESQMTQVLRYQDVEAEVLFRALDRPEDVRKLLSLELTGAWLNEAREISKPIFDTLCGRVGRYPRKSQTSDVTGGWFGIVGDSNPPDNDHWIYRIFEEEKPPGFKIFHQPSGLAAEAENVENLPPEYYSRLCAGKDEEWVKVYVHGEYGFITDGKPVHPQFKTTVHVAPDFLEPRPVLPIYFGCDFGLTPAAVFGQQLPSGRWLILREIVTEDMGAERFGGLVSEALRGPYSKFSIDGWGDPAGDERSVIRENENVFSILIGQGIPISPAPSNDPVLRQEALNHLLGKLDMAGEPALTICPSCKTLIKGLSGGYRYRRLAVSGTDRFTEKPEKNHYSHICEALHYMLLGAGVGSQVMDGRITGALAAKFYPKPRVIRAL